MSSPTRLGGTLTRSPRLGRRLLGARRNEKEGQSIQFAETGARGRHLCFRLARRHNRGYHVDQAHPPRQRVELRCQARGDVITTAALVVAEKGGRSGGVTQLLRRRGSHRSVQDPLQNSELGK
ncbi:hypothetical protein BHE74_00015625 [Ensete ventricosum]|nr:hypothetical protein BHE74_00015625 [Ensete ventricosum]